MKNDWMEKIDLLAREKFVNQDGWVPISQVKEELSFGNQQAAGMRVSLREIEIGDAEVIGRALMAKNPSMDAESLRRAFATAREGGRTP